MGTPDFAVPCLEKLCEYGHEVVGVFSQPDKPVGRKQILTAPPVKEFAVSRNIPVFQPARIKGSDSEKIIRGLQPDVIVVVAYGKILPPEILAAAPYGCINVHASLLPKYRGAAPIQWAVLNGEEETGVCIMQMDEGLDTGDIILCKKTEIGINETSGELFDRLSVLGGEALIDALDMIENNTAQRLKQPQGDFGYASMINRELCPIDWSKSAFEIHNKVRGLQPWPVAITTYCGKNIKIHRTVLTDISEGTAGEVTESDKRLIVSCGDGKCIEITELQLEGKKRMDAKSFLLGNKIEKGSFFS